MQLAIPWPNPDDLRKEERGVTVWRCSLRSLQRGEK